VLFKRVACSNMRVCEFCIRHIYVLLWAKSINILPCNKFENGKFRRVVTCHVKPDSL